MKGLRVASAVVVVIMGVSLSSCCGGGKKQPPPEKTPIKVENKVETKSAGEQLLDLQKAYESGAISEEEYNKMKQDIIKKSGKE